MNKAEKKRRERVRTRYSPSTTQYRFRFRSWPMGSNCRSSSCGTLSDPLAGSFFFGGARATRQAVSIIFLISPL